MRRALVQVLIALAVVQGTAQVRAFEVVPAGAPGEYLKWGASKLAGTGGGEVTWAFVAAGTPGTGYCSPYCQGESLGALPNFYPSPKTDNHTAALPIEQLQPVFQAAFEAWSAVADIRFRYVGVDASLVPIDGAVPTEPMIRIGIWRHAGLAAYFCAAAAYPPGLRGRGADAHVFLNANVGYQLSHDPEGGRVDDFPRGGGLHMTDLYLLALRETGHTIGLADSTHPDSVMRRGDASATLRPTPLWRTPRADDVAGARFLYGAASAGRR